MPSVARSRDIAAAAEEIWQVVCDPYHLPRWWPGVERVEEATPEAWTEVFRSQRGKTVRADFTRVEAEEPRRLVWQQEIKESPFERFLAESRSELSLEPRNGGTTRVRIRSVQRLRGLSRFGGLMIRRATARRLDEALESLAAVTEPR